MDAATGQPKKRTFRTFSYRGVEMEKLLDMSIDEWVELLPSRQRRKCRKGLRRKPCSLVKKLIKVKKETPYGEKPNAVNTHLRDTIVTPAMVGSVVGVYNGKQFINSEIKPEMLGHYLGEFSITYKPVRHGKPGIGATHSSRFIPLK